jgi:hypothetical protein
MARVAKPGVRLAVFVIAVADPDQIKKQILGRKIRGINSLRFSVRLKYHIERTYRQNIGNKGVAVFALGVSRLESVEEFWVAA